MQYVIKLECDLKNEAEYFQHQAAALAAMKLYTNYISIKGDIFGTGPELFAEQWLRTAFSDSDIYFENLILIYFIKILWGVQHGK